MRVAARRRVSISTRARPSPWWATHSIWTVKSHRCGLEDVVSISIQNLLGLELQCRPMRWGVQISNLELYGGNCWTPTNLGTYVLPPRVNGWGNDGILLAGGEPKLENVLVACFKRHGIHLAGDSFAYAAKEYGYSQPDYFRFERIGVRGNRGYGVYVVGGDSNAGLATFIDARGNQLGGIYDFSVLGNTWVTPGMHSNTRNPVMAGATQAVSSIRITSGVTTITTVGASGEGTGHGWELDHHDWFRGP